MIRAPVFARFVALMIDMLVVKLFSVTMCTAALMGYRTGSGRITFDDLSAIVAISPFFFIITFFFYFTYLPMDRGMTPGKSLVGIKVIRSGTDDVPEGLGFPRAFLRAAAYGLSASLCFMGFLMAFLPGGRALHDIIAGTRVVTVTHLKEES
jgi:uncharacterized RDD family membrane protein YckC